MRWKSGVLGGVTLLALGQQAWAGAPARLTSAAVNGVYADGQNDLSLLLLPGGRLKLLVEADGGGRGSMAGEAKVTGNVAAYQSNEFGPCRVTFTFSAEGRVDAVTDGTDAACGFGSRANADGAYKRTKVGVPTFPEGEAMLSSVQSLVAAPTKLAPTTASELETVAGVVTLEQTEARTATHVAVGAQGVAGSQGDRRKALLASLKTLRADHDKHQKAGAAAQQAYKSGVKASQASPAALEKLKLANDEYTQANQAAKSILAKTAELRNSETELGKQLALALDAAAEAELAGKDAAKNATLVKAQAGVIERAKKQPKPAVDAKTAQKSATLAAQTKLAAADASAAAKDAKNALAAVTKIAGASTQKAWTTLRQHARDDDGKQIENLDKTRRAFEQVAIASKHPGQPPPTCDIRKHDWENRRYANGLVLRHGKDTQGKIDDLTWEEWSLDNVEYADTDADGLVEAFVSLGHSNTSAGGNYSTTYVFELDEACQPLSRGELNGSGKLTNKRYVIDLPFPAEGDPSCCPSGTYHAEYKLVGDAPQDVSHSTR